MAKKKWIKKALEGAHGQFSAKAKRAGKSTSAYATEHENDAGKVGKQARLAKTLMGMQRSNQKNTPSHKSIRKSMYGKEE